MIIINESFVITGKEDLESFIADLQPFAISDLEKKTIEIVEKYFRECYSADLRLTEMVTELFSDKQVMPLVIMNFGETDDFNEINFSLLTEDENVKIKKREELKFRDLCDICFGSIVGLQDRIDIYFEDYQRFVLQVQHLLNLM